MNGKKYVVKRGCELCMTCIYQCPMGAISIIPDVSAVIDEDKCVGCGRCKDACQPGAIIEATK